MATTGSKSLLQPTRISRIRLLNNEMQNVYRIRDYKIEISMNDRSYRQIAKGTLPNEGRTWTEVKIEPVRIKYLRFTSINGYANTHGVGLKEIEVFE